HQRERVCEDQYQHGRHEQVELGEEARVAVIAVHVADRVDVYQEADAGDDQCHHQAELINHEAEVEAQVARAEESSEVDAYACRVSRVGDEGYEGKYERRADSRASQNAWQRLLERATEEAVDDRPLQRQQRSKGHQLHEVDSRVAHACTSDSPSTSVLTRLRKIATRMPSPTATSAAATARMMKPAPWPANA